MPDFAIICEFNPMHRGHQYLIEQARERGADRVVCIMSGASVQRGTLAVTDPYVRAECALRAGADLVLELPYPWCSASAEQFAAGGVRIASQMADTLIFGSECGDAELIRKGAKIASDADFRAHYRQTISQGAPAAGAYYSMLEAELGQSLSSNDILGVEYVRAMRQMGSSMNVLTVRREGASYHESRLEENRFPSATGIRALWASGGFSEAERYLPRECIETYRRAKEEGRFVSEKKLESLILGWFRLHSGEDFSHVAGAEGGLCHRFCAVAERACDLSTFYEEIRTKRYTDSHIARTLLYCMTGVRASDFADGPQYTTLLAANEKGRALLSERRKSAQLPVITKPADAPTDTAQCQLTERLHRLFFLATEQTEEGGAMLKKTPYII